MAGLELQKTPPATPATDTQAAASYGRVTARAILLSLLLTILNDYWIVQLEVVRYSFATYAAPFYNCVFTLLVCVGANALVRQRWPSKAFTRVEMLTVYVMVSISSAVCSHNMMEILVSLMGYAHWFKTPDNHWGELFADRLPRWLTVSDHEALRNFYYGDSSLYRPENWHAWIVPVLCWSAFCAILLFTMLCLNTILRKQWVENERLTFPIVMLPLEMTHESGALFRNKHMWLGFAIAGAITLVAGLHYLWPSIPHIPIVRRNIGQYITQPPWNAMGGIPMGFYFWAIGLAFLMPLELSISCWVFYWLVNLEQVGCAALGWNQLTVPGGGFDSAFPFKMSQSWGAYVGFFVMSMWNSRRYLGRVIRTAFMGTKEEDDSSEAISYGAAILGALAGVTALSFVAFAIGMSWWVICVFWTFYFVFAVICSRIRAELGFPTHDMHVMQPQHLIETAVGTQRLAHEDKVGFALFYWFNRTYASHPSPHQLESFKIAERTNIHARQMFVAVLIAGVFAMPIGFWMLLNMYYHNGGATARVEQWALGFGSEAWRNLEAQIQRPYPANPTAMAFVGVGFAISMLLGWSRTRFAWFPLHPLAYAIAPSWGVSQLWMPLMIGSTAKLLILKFGGLKTYRSALPFFYGLILGEICVGSLWTLVGVVLGIPTYDFWPGRYQ